MPIAWRGEEPQERFAMGIARSFVHLLYHALHRSDRAFFDELASLVVDVLIFNLEDNDKSSTLAATCGILEQAGFQVAGGEKANVEFVFRREFCDLLTKECSVSKLAELLRAHWK